jgi:hypothetical protein
MHPTGELHGRIDHVPTGIDVHLRLQRAGLVLVTADRLRRSDV